MKKIVKLTSETRYWSCPDCDKPHITWKDANEVRCGRCGTEFITAQYNMKQELKITKARLEMVEFTLGQYKKILKGGMSSLIDPDKVVLHYKCCECKATVNKPLKKFMHAFVCDECNYVENFMELAAVAIKAE